MTTWTDLETNTSDPWNELEVVTDGDIAFDANIAFDADVPFDGFNLWETPVDNSTTWTVIG